MPTTLTTDEAVEILEYLGARITTNDGFVLGVVQINETSCVYPHVDISNGSLDGTTGDRFRRALGNLSYDQFERLRSRDMTPDEFRRTAALRLGHD